MRAKVVKWGDGLGLPLPESIAEEAGLVEGSVVNLDMENGELIVRVTSQGVVCLEDLLGGITEDNIHREVTTGDTVGGEGR